MFMVTRIIIFSITIVIWEAQGSSISGCNSSALKNFLPLLHERGSTFIEAISCADVEPDSAAAVTSVDNTGYALRTDIEKARDLVRATDFIEPLEAAEIRSRCFSLFAPTQLLSADIPESKYSTKTISSISTAAATTENSLTTAGNAIDIFHYAGKNECDSKLQYAIKALLDVVLRTYKNLAVLLTEMARSFDDNPEAVSNQTLQYTSKVVVEDCRCISFESYKVADVVSGFQR